jgi:pre-rRNA-processing protein IPI1
MGSSNRKKKEKLKDFQKPKLKVGKTKPKAANFTNTSFKSKGQSAVPAPAQREEED